MIQLIATLPVCSSCFSSTCGNRRFSDAGRGQPSRETAALQGPLCACLPILETQHSPQLCSLIRVRGLLPEAAGGEHGPEWVERTEGGVVAECFVASQLLSNLLLTGASLPFPWGPRTRTPRQERNSRPPESKCPPWQSKTPGGKYED